MKPILTLFAISAFFCGYSHANPLQVFILAGQSNMQGHAKVTTFEHIGMDPAELEVSEGELHRHPHAESRKSASPVQAPDPISQLRIAARLDPMQTAQTHELLTVEDRQDLCPAEFALGE